MRGRKRDWYVIVFLLLSTNFLFGFTNETVKINAGIWASPNITSVTFDEYDSEPDGYIRNLNPGGIRKIFCIINITDRDGVSDINTTSIKVIINSSVNPSPGAEHKKYEHHINPPDGELRCNISLETNSVLFNCSFNASYIIENGTWYCHTTISDNHGLFDSSYSTSQVEQLIAFNITSASKIIDFGTVNVYENVTGPQYNITFFNMGNVGLKINANAYGNVTYDNVSMICALNNISKTSLRFNNQSDIFDFYTPLESGTYSQTNITTLPEEVNVTGIPRYVFLGIEAKGEKPPAGTCNGFIFLDTTIYDVFDNSPEDGGGGGGGSPSKSWQGPVSLDTSGFKPTMSIFPNGTQRMFYNIQFASTRLTYRSRGNPYQQFSNYSNTSNTCSYASTAFSDNSNFWLSCESATASIYNTTNGGESYTFEKAYSSRSGTCTGYYKSVLVKNEDNLTIFYNYEFDTGIFGCTDQLYFAKKNSSGWSASGTQIQIGGDDTFGQILDAHQNGNEYLVIASNVLRSNNSGENWTIINNEGTIEERLSSISGTAQDTYGNIYAIRAYTFGPIGQEYNIEIRNSSNFGLNWSILYGNYDKPQIMSEPKIAISGNVIVSAWLENEDGYYQNITYIMSSDLGGTWTSPALLKSYDGTSYELENMEIHSSNGNFIISYDTKESGSFKGIEYIEYK